ncbi:MAG: UDP-N-acetylglucosamine--N-acetylmuramyl-(pentapeptide) pyrophosphoryl-undecaprenol N-acetylglucosamine transferase [bacterium]
MKIKILLVGGGTMGSVSPLIAVYQKIKKIKPDTEFLFLGTSQGPEKTAVESYKIPFKVIVSGKLRRYFSWKNFIDPFKVVFAFFQSIIIILKFKPDAIMIAGSFAGVPVTWAATILGRRVLIHQQDILAGLANKLMANTANTITISFEPSLRDYGQGKTVFTGNAVREEFSVCEKTEAKKIFGLSDSLPTVLIMGGGTGANKINETVEKSLAELLQFCQVMHITGVGKKNQAEAENYHQFEFLTNETVEAFCAADLVVSRSGMSSLCELAVMAKPAIVIPIPGHQELNAQYFQKNNAVMVLSQESLNSEIFISMIKELLFSAPERENLSRNISKLVPPDGADKIASLLLGLTRKD